MPRLQNTQRSLLPETPRANSACRLASRSPQVTVRHEFTPMLPEWRRMSRRCGPPPRRGRTRLSCRVLEGVERLFGLADLHGLLVYRQARHEGDKSMCGEKMQVGAAGFIEKAPAGHEVIRHRQAGIDPDDRWPPPLATMMRSGRGMAPSGASANSSGTAEISSKWWAVK